MNTPSPQQTNDTPAVIIQTSEKEERLARIYNYLYPVWKSVLFSWLASVAITVLIMRLSLAETDPEVMRISVIIASVCSISISAIVSQVAYTYHSLISEKNEMLLTYASDLTHANKELDAFARTVAHDIKTPLSNVIGYSSFLLEEFGELSEEETLDLLSRLRSVAEDAVGITDEILLLARTLKVDVDVDTINVGETVNRAVERLSHLVRQSDATIEYPESWPSAIGYAPWVEEIWVNYISNALKYGGAPPKLVLGASFEGGKVRFWVEDNGDGLTPVEQQMLFNEFTRLHPERASGNGLGLSIVLRITEKLGGQAGVESEPGRGSRFYFTLPKPAA